MPKEKLNYLTPNDLTLTREEVNLQLTLGLQTCKTKKDVCDLLNDVRFHERKVAPSYEPKIRYLEFIDVSNPNNKTKRFNVWNIVTNQKIGQIRWDTGWRCYIFDDGELKMAEGCEFEMFEKLKELKINRTEERK